MADWKQITARIRRARTGKDPVAQLSNLYEKTRDAMVAFELARLFETSGQNADAAKWYVAAAERFRRADWKSKAQEAAVRLGADLSAATAGSTQGAESGQPAVSEEQPEVAEQEEGAVAESVPSDPQPTADSPAQPAETSDGRRRRRGRRGGRNRRKGTAATTSSRPAATDAAADSPADVQSSPEISTASDQPKPAHRRSTSAASREFSADTSISVRGRSGDPGLSSRLSGLEMQLRRLLSCTPVKLSDADHAPAGPGVFILSDSDLSSYYYVEACQTLRVAVGNLLRGGSSRRGAESIKPQLAEHLGIPEARVSKYLADHCVVRWLQLDEGASLFAHFVIALLRPALNE